MIKQFLKQFTSVLFITMALLLMFGGIVYAATWEYKYPIIISDSSNTTRTYLPVMLGFGGQNLINAGKISTSGNDTNMQVGASSIKYMLSTTNCTAVIPNLPSGGKSTADLYTGYSPEQSAFSIITGYNGYITTANHTSLNIGNSGNYTWSGYFNTTSTGYLKNRANDLTIKGNGSGIITANTYDNTGVIFPIIDSTANTTAASATTLTADMPSGCVADDLILAVIGTYNIVGARTITPPSGWTQLFNTAYGSYYTHGVWYKIAVGTEGSSANWSSSGNVSYSVVAMRIDKSSYVGIPVAGTTATGTGTQTNPPSLTSGFGIVDTLWLATYLVGADISANLPPANYTSVVESLGGTGYYTSVCKRDYLSASDNPAAGGGLTDWEANTIAIQGGVSVSTTALSTGIHTISVYLTGGVFGIIADGVDVNKTYAGSIPASSTNMTWCTSNIMPYCDYISVYKGATQTVLYQPNAMISGTTLPDRATGDGSQDGTITWGTNTGLTISYGEMSSYASTEAGISETGGFNMPESEMPDSWFAGGGLTGLPFYDTYLSVSTSTGQPVETLYFLSIIGFAFGVFMLLVIFTRSALLATVGFNIVLFIGSSMSIVPGWLPFSILIVQIGIMYLYKQVAY